MEGTQDWEEWQRQIFESFRPVDPTALFWLTLFELDFRSAPGHALADFPFSELQQFVDGWLAGLDPDGPRAETEWSGGGVRLRLGARGRDPRSRGWSAMPSLLLLDQPVADLHLVGAGRRQLHALELDEVRRLASGELRVIGQGASYQETFQMTAEMLERFGLSSVGQLSPTDISVIAGMLGLVEAPPDSLGNFEQGWRGFHGIPPDE